MSEREGPKSTAFYNRSAATPPNSIEVPQLDLSRGVGALKAVDETFTVNAASGTAALGLPLPVTEARTAPAASLRYDSGRQRGLRPRDGRSTSPRSRGGPTSSGRATSTRTTAMAS